MTKVADLIPIEQGLRPINCALSNYLTSTRPYSNRTRIEAADILMACQKGAHIAAPITIEQGLSHPRIGCLPIRADNSTHSIATWIQAHAPNCAHGIAISSSCTYTLRFYTSTFALLLRPLTRMDIRFFPFVYCLKVYSLSVKSNSLQFIGR